jgi:hypothetical protein
MLALWVIAVVSLVGAVGSILTAITSSRTARAVDRMNTSILSLQQAVELNTTVTQKAGDSSDRAHAAMSVLASWLRDIKTGVQDVVERQSRPSLGSRPE